MLFDVYYFTGDAVDTLKAGPCTGELVLKRTGRDNGLMAYLYRSGTQEELMTPLRHAQVLAMNQQGMSIEGYVTQAQRPALKSKTTTYAVRWIIKQVGAPAVLDTVKLKARSARRLATAAANGFDPDDDNKGF